MDSADTIPSTLSHSNGSGLASERHYANEEQRYSKSDTDTDSNEDLPKIVIEMSEPNATDPMVCQNQPDTRKPPDGGYGWFVVLGCFLSHILIGGLERCDGIFFLEFKKKFGLSAQLTAWPGALVSALRLGMGPVAGALSNRYSVRTTCLVGAIFFFAGLFLNGFAPNFYFLFLSHFFIQGVGRGLVYAPGLIIVGLYFDKKRSFATGLSTSGVGVGTFIVIPLAQLLFDTYGFKYAFIILGAIALNVSVSAMLYRPLSLYFKFRSGKEVKSVDDICLEESLVLANAIETSDVQSIRSWKAYHRSFHDVNNPDNNCQIKSDDTKSTVNVKKNGWLKTSLHICFPVEKRETKDGKKGIFNLHLLKNPSFLMLCFSIMLFTAAFKSAFTFIPALVKSQGFSESESGFVLSITGIFDTLGRIGFGFLFDRAAIRPLRPVFFNSLLFGIAIISFIVPNVTNYIAICLICGFYGSLTGAYVSQKAVVSVDILGVENIASSFGLLICFQAFGMCLGPPLSGAIRDISGTFHLSFVVGGVLMICAAGLMTVSNIFLRKQRQRESEKRKQ